MFKILIISILSIALNFNKAEFYSVFSDESLNKIEKQISVLENSNIKYKNAYLGALYMKQAAYLKVPAKKLKVFKQGHKLLEEEIKKNPKKTEWRFLRLAIQENAPKMLKYNKNIQEDKGVIISNYHNLDATVKKAVKDYAQNSGILKLKELE